MIKTFEEYQNETEKTAIYPKEHGLNYCLFGLGGEVGEMLGKYSKVFRDNQCIFSDELKAKMRKELGDVLWFCSQYAKELGTTLEVVATENIENLKGRRERNTINGDGDDR